MTTPNFKVTPAVYASKEKRFINFIVDYAIQLVLAFIIGMAIALLAELTGSYSLYEWFIESDSRLSDYIFGIIILLIYYIIIESITSRSIGKYLTKTKVVLEDGSEPGVKDVILRSLCRIIPFEVFSFLGETGRGWHDSISDTYVVDIVKFEAKRTTNSEIDLIGKSEEI